MGFFDKKYCDICGEKIGLLGNRKLEDGNLCKDCARKLSPWFNERRHSTVDEIKEQLAYREENNKKAAEFRTTRSIGADWKVLLDETHRWMTVTRASNLKEANPDIVSFDDITGYSLDIDESRSEIMREGADGKEESYNPPRYRYSYDFDMVIHVSNPYFDEMKFRINPNDVEYEPQPSMQRGFMGRSFGTLTGDNGVNPEQCFEYRKYRDMGQEICSELDRVRGIASSYTTQNAQPAMASAPMTSASMASTPMAAAAMAAAGGMAAGNKTWFCVNCGTSNSGKFCANCGTPKPEEKPRFCTNCGWKAEDPASMPKFCPECGNPFT